MWNETKISYSIVKLVMLRAWCIRQRLVCVMHTDGKLISHFIPWLGPPRLVRVVFFSWCFACLCS